jgi:fused signal recognition particle receptor
MALGFIKKMFSFGKKEDEQDSAAAPQVQQPLAVIPELPVAPAPEVLPAPTPVPEVPVEKPLEVPADPVAEPEVPPTPVEPEVPAQTPALPVAPDVPQPAPVEVPAEQPAEPAAPVEPQPEPEEVPAVPEPELPDTPETADLTKAAPVADESASEPADQDGVAPVKVIVSKAVETKVDAAPVEVAPAPRLSWYQRLSQGLSRSSRELRDSISGVFTKRKLDEDTLQDLEDVLLRADLGMETAIRVTDTLASGRYGKEISGEEVRSVMAQEIEKVLTPVAVPLELNLSHKPHVILVVGVNGTGKTTTIGKLAAKLSAGGLKVMLAAGDTFRAAAIEQLKIWGERTNSPVISSKLGADAAGLAYDAFEKAKEAGSDVLIIDTAGRLQNKAELMAELEKVVRVLAKLDPEAPHTVLQTVDATTGQNALNQVEIFRNIAGVNGLVMTKLDGTARGGILVAIAAKHKLPVYFIGVGEQVDDLEPFSANEFARAIAGVN